MDFKKLASIKYILGTKIRHSDWADWSLKKASREFIVINHSNNKIIFKMQKEPVRETGVNGCEVEELIELSRILTANLPGKGKAQVLATIRLTEALNFMEKYRNDRIDEGKEGTDIDE